MTDLSDGDLVKLKSGGLEMTVEKVEGAIITCVWFVGVELKRESFNTSVLCKAATSEQKAQKLKRIIQI